MEKLGVYWRRSICEVPAIRDEASNHNVLLQDVLSRETVAERALKPLMEGKVQAGVTSCIARGSISLGFQIPDGVEGTAFYDQFRSWAKEQDLMVYVMHERGQPQRLLVVTPLKD